MERSQLAPLLHRLSTHLRSDVAKVVASCADAIAATEGDEALAARIFASAHTKKQREALQTTAAFLSTLATINTAQQSIRHLAAVLSNQPVQPARPARKTTPKAAKEHVVEELAIRFAGELNEARLDRDRFLELHRQLSDTKKVSTPTLHRIARVFLQSDTKYSGRKKALDDIMRRHHDSLRIAAQDQVLDRLQ